MHCMVEVYDGVRLTLDVHAQQGLDNALDHGLPVIKSTKNLVRVITYPEYSSRKCPLCDTENLEEPTLVEHVITYHTKSDTRWSSLLRHCVPWTIIASVMFYASYISFKPHCMFFFCRQDAVSPTECSVLLKTLCL